MKKLQIVVLLLLAYFHCILTFTIEIHCGPISNVPRQFDWTNGHHNNFFIG
jgi:hypothetical protein